METPVSAFAPTPAPAVRGKGFGIRAGAYIIDVVVIWVTTLVVSFGTGLVIGFLSFFINTGLNFEGRAPGGLNLLLGLFSATFYFAMFEWLHGSTPGKLILGMRVVMDDWRPCTLVAAVIRGVVRWIDGLFFGIPAYLSMKEPLLQRLGDKTAKTLVVDAKSAFITNPREWWWMLIAFGLVVVEELIAALIGLFSLA